MNTRSFYPRAIFGNMSFHPSEKVRNFFPVCFIKLNFYLGIFLPVVTVLVQVEPHPSQSFTTKVRSVYFSCSLAQVSVSQATQ